ncbi:hypothetical protein [Streptomyces sp. NPDC051561]|uniref:hypothetical protein n=1 Tax=Streptomyces sp. NPDC051561 TaxID=3365658 RepID=UPI0037938ABB
MPGIDWDEEFSRMNPKTETPEKPSPSKFSAKLSGVRRNTAALAVCGTIAVVAVCGTVVTVTSMQGQQAAQDRARAKEDAANALVEVEAGKRRAQTEEAVAKTLYEREMTVYRECMKARAATVAKAPPWEVSKIPACDAPTLGGTQQPKAQESAAGGDFLSSPWLWVALVGGGGLVAYKKLSAPSASASGAGALTHANNKGFTFEKGA